jgi:hypothetical protein
MTKEGDLILGLISHGGHTTAYNLKQTPQVKVKIKNLLYVQGLYVFKTQNKQHRMRLHSSMAKKKINKKNLYINFFFYY